MLVFKFLIFSLWLRSKCQQQKRPNVVTVLAVFWGFVLNVEEDIHNFLTLEHHSE